MFRKNMYILISTLLIAFQTNAQFRSETPASSGNTANGVKGAAGSEDGTVDEKKKKSIPSVIRVWELKDNGATSKAADLDTTLTFYHVYHRFEQRSISNEFTGNIGGAYQSNDFFNRTYHSDFYFARSFDAYLLTPSQIQYFNTTTPFTLLDYTQSENRSRKNETRFDVFHSQNVNRKLNFEFIYNQNKSQGQYPSQVAKFHNVALVSSYLSDKFLSHTNIIFNRQQTEENGGIEPGQILGETDKTEDFTVMMDDAENRIQNNNYFTSNEYRLGKFVETDSAEYLVDRFIPRVGFIYEFEYSDNKRKFTKASAGDAFFENTPVNATLTNDSIKYRRMSNIFQIKFYEAPDRKYTFGKRAYIGSDLLTYHFSTELNGEFTGNEFKHDKQTNVFVGGGIFRNEGKFWQWEANGRIYLTGYRAGQTDLNGFVNKPLRIGKDTTSLRVSGSLKTIVPDYFMQHFYSNYFIWNNYFCNINELNISGVIHSQRYKTSIGANYALIGNYIYNNEQALPTQASGELMVISASLNKDFESKHWLIRTRMLAQKSGNTNYLNLPDFAGFISINYRTLWSKVLYTQLGIDTRYNTAFYSDAYQPGTGSYYLQHEQKSGNYPFIDLHVNLKLKRTRFFFKILNAASGFIGDNYYSAPDYPFYRRTYRLGVSWSFYD